MDAYLRTRSQAERLAHQDAEDAPDRDHGGREEAGDGIGKGR